MNFYIIIIVISIFLFVTLLISYICYRLAFRRSNAPPDPRELLERENYATYKEESEKRVLSLAAREFQRVEIVSCDGKRLVGKMYRGDDGAPIHIMLHGYRSQAGWDFSGGAEECLALGHGVLLPDQRAHAESAGHAITFGVLERRDVHSWAEYIARKFDTDIYIWGISMGAASVLMSLDFPFPDKVRAVIADCPYSSPSDIIRLVGERMKLPATLLMPFARLGAFLFGSFRLGNSSAVGAIKNAKIPVLLFHGEADNFVPYEMSRKIYESAKEAGVDIEFHSFEGAGHGMSYLSDISRYQKIVWDFLKRTQGTKGEDVNEVAEGDRIT